MTTKHLARASKKKAHEWVKQKINNKTQSSNTEEKKKHTQHLIQIEV